MRRDLAQAKIVLNQYYSYMLGYRFDPGAEAEVFLPKTALPEIVYRGAGRLAGQLLPLQMSQVYFHKQNGIVGLGGTQTGQMILQPLLDPSQDGQ